jgi:glycosyltransferase involved in cell wall biosynthesis
MLKVLVWGHVEDGPCAYFRGHQFTEELKKLGVEYKGLNKVNFNVKPGGEKMLMPEAFNKGFIEFDSTDVDWADVVVFRRYYNTTLSCVDEQCPFVTFSYQEAIEHPHGWKERDLITRLLWPAFRFASHNKAIVYETDDDHFNVKDWNGYKKDILPELAMIEEMAQRADLLTTSTDVIGKRYSRFNDNIRVIRNAIDPELYKPTIGRPAGDKPRMVYYGSTARIRDYAGFPEGPRGKLVGGYAAKAAEDLRKEMTRVFIGVNPGTEHFIAPLFDEQVPYVEGIAKFCETLANSHPDIGIAPLMGDDFDQAKSELHWLEYALVGGAFIGERSRNGGPYDVVRDGVDGLLARGRGEWYEAMKKLTRSKDLREQLAGAARERVLKEYDYKDRAKEWADAFKWAAENKGKGAKIA